MEIERQFASKGVGTAGLTTGIIGTALGALNSMGGNFLGLGNNTACVPSENQHVNRYELAQEQKISELQSQIALRDANTYGDQKLLEVYKYFDGKLGEVNAELRNIAVYQANNTATISCLANQVNGIQCVLNGLTKTVIPADNVCPQPMAMYNSWTAPTATT
jgi:hypothetical protein